MDQPFTPKAYAGVLARRWPLILITVVVAVAVAVVLSFLTPVAYTAKAVLVAPTEQLAWRWENKISDVVDTRFDWRVEVTSLLGTDELAARVLADVEGQLVQPLTTEQLVAAIRVHLGDGSLFDVMVTASNPEDAALLANAVAEALSEAVADFYAGDLAANQKALETALVEYRKWDQALTDFRSQHGSGLGLSGDLATGRGDALFGAQSALKQELTLKNSERAGLQTALDRIDMVLRAEDPQTLPVALLDLPELQQYGTTFAELQRLAQTDPQALLGRLQGLRDLLAADLALVTEDALARQTTESGLQQQFDNLLRSRGVWLESVAAFERRAVELQMKRIVEGGRVQVVDEAVPPVQPSQPMWMLNLGAALIGGLLFGLLLAVASVYLDKENHANVGG